MKKHIRPAITWLFVVLIAGYVGRRSISHDHVPRFMNGYSYAESAYAVTRQLRDETHALRSYVRQLPWPEGGWIFREFTEGTVPVFKDGEFIGRDDFLDVYSDSVWVKCRHCGWAQQRYEMRRNR